ncbi:MAG: RNA-directed DNA polymerase [Cyanobium sp.]
MRRFIAASRAHRWVLTADIRLYFPSIDHQLLLAQLKQVITCQPTLWLLATILANGAEPATAIDAFPGDTLLTPLERPRGLPIGNLTSQFLANFHLDRFDHSVHRLNGIGAYLRYVDDFALFAAHREPLERARAVIERRLASLRLRLHPIKSQIRRCGDGAILVVFSCGRPGCGCATTTCSRAGDASSARPGRWRPAIAAPRRPGNRS